MLSLQHHHQVLPGSGITSPTPDTDPGARRGAVILYNGYVDVNPQIMGLRVYNVDILLLVIPTTSYGKEVSIITNTKVIDKAMKVITQDELNCASAIGDRPI